MSIWTIQKILTNPDFIGQHHWLELDNNPSDEFLNEFEEEMYKVSNDSSQEEQEVRDIYFNENIDIVYGDEDNLDEFTEDEDEYFTD